MNAATRRRLIANKSPFQKIADPRPTCEDCGAVLMRSDFTSYWDGGDPHVDGCIPRGANITPRVCENCCENAVVSG
jgi:hypothetical protein